MNGAPRARPSFDVFDLRVSSCMDLVGIAKVVTGSLSLCVIAEPE